jgi:flagella basal body P-ring formation protein FlgA
MIGCKTPDFGDRLRTAWYCGAAGRCPSVVFAVLAAVLQVVDAQAAQLTTERAQAAIMRHVLESGPWKAGDIEVRVTPFPSIPLSDGAGVIRILRPNKGVTPGPLSFLLAVDIAGKEQARTWVKSEIRVFDEVLVSSAPLARHETITVKDVRVERRDISGLNARPLTRIEEVAGWQAARAIEVNEILTQKSLDRPSLLRRGSPVTLLYETGGLRVEAPGLAVEAGKIGEVIQVKNPTSGKLLRGLIVDARTVRVN